MTSRDAAEGISLSSSSGAKPLREVDERAGPADLLVPAEPAAREATIAARLCGVELEIRGATPRELAGWLWDFDAQPLADGESGDATARAARTGFGGTLHKTDAFLAAHPFGTVPAAFSPDGATGIFESNSILRAVARLGAANAKLYGDDPYAASRIDSFLDASLVFARRAGVPC
jgi:glutathione S-transferase